MTRKSDARAKQASAGVAQRTLRATRAGFRDMDTSTPLAPSEPMQRIALVREGVPATAVESLANTLGLPKDHLLEGLGLARATVNRKLAAGTRLSASESERVVGLAQILDRVERSLVGSDSEAADVRVGPWLGSWLDTPNAALGEHRPLSLLDTADGRTLVDDVLASMETGSYW